LSVAAGLADRICVMYAGRIVEEGATADVLTAPRHPYTRGLLDSVPANAKPRERLRQIPGASVSLSQLISGCAFRPRCARAQADCELDPEMSVQNARGQAARCFHPLEAP
jgi:peptide/nickel transport system ATP-binding protein